jgi:hypothetical protein
MFGVHRSGELPAEELHVRLQDGWQTKINLE